MNDVADEQHTIYLVTNLINGKKYVGFTKFPLDVRWGQHVKQAKYEARRNELRKSNGNRAILAAIRKYGDINFSIESICAAVNRREAGELEKFWIAYHKSKGEHGYNITLGGEGCSGYVLTEARRQQLSDNNKGAKNYWNGRSGGKHFGYGKKLSEQHIEKLRENNAGSVALVINGVTYRSKAEAMRVFGVPKSSVSRLVNWEEELSKIQHRRVEIAGVMYAGIKEAARKLGTTKYKLDKAITEQNIGRYVTEPYSFYEFVEYLQGLSKSKRPVMYNGKYYDSIRALTEKLRYNRDVILRKIREGEITECSPASKITTHNAIPVEFCGKVFASKTALMREFGISGKELNRLLAAGDIRGVM